MCLNKNKSVFDNLKLPSCQIHNFGNICLTTINFGPARNVKKQNAKN